MSDVFCRHRLFHQRRTAMLDKYRYKHHLLRHFSLWYKPYWYQFIPGLWYKSVDKTKLQWSLRLKICMNRFTSLICLAALPQHASTKPGSSRVLLACTKFHNIKGSFTINSHWSRAPNKCYSDLNYRFSHLSKKVSCYHSVKPEMCAIWVQQHKRFTHLLL